MAFGTIMILFGIGIAIIGVAMLLAGNVMWAAQEMDNASDGQVSERSSLWDAKRIVMGLFFIIGGLVFVIGGFGMRSDDDGNSGERCLDAPCVTATPFDLDEISPLWPGQVDATPSPAVGSESATP